MLLFYSFVFGVLEVRDHLCFDELDVEVSGLAVEYSLLYEHAQAVHVVVD